MRRDVPLLAVLLLAAACAAPTDPTETPAAANGQPAVSTWAATVANAGPGAMPIQVYAQNVYPGFDIDKIEIAFGQGQEAAIMALTNGLLVLDQTDWAERADRMAAEIAARDPDVIVLNELVTVRREGFQTVSGFLQGTPLEPLAPYWAMLPDETVDFLPVFQQALASHGLHYALVDTLRLTDIQVPVPGFPVTVAARYVDRDAMLVREDVTVESAKADTFATTLQTITTQTRGWIAADLEVHGKPWRVVGTHPNPTWAEAGKPGHITELLASLSGVTRPTIIAGDLNLEPSFAEYGQLTSAGFVDLWAERNGQSAAANTCCHGDDETLRDPNDGLEKRIDYVLARPAAGYAVGPVQFTIFGDELSERTTPSAMWPSDHAGLFAGVVLQKRLQP